MRNPQYHARGALLALATLIVLSLNACSNHAGIEGPAPRVSFKTLESATPLKLEALGKPLLVNFWSTSCGICLIEMPHLTEIYKEFNPKGFEMVAVAARYDIPSDVVRMSQDFNWPFLVALDMQNEVAEAFGDINGTPTSFLINAEGNIVEKYVGAMDLKEFRQTLTKVLAL